MGTRVVQVGFLPVLGKRIRREGMRVTTPITPFTEFRRVLGGTCCGAGYGLADELYRHSVLNDSNCFEQHILYGHRGRARLL